MAYFDCIVGGSGKGNTLVVTCADDLAGATITCTNGTKTYTKTCPSTSPYEVTFYGLAAGTYTVSATVSGNTYTTTVVVADIEALLGGFNWKTWVDLSQNYTSSDFTDLDDLLSDETAIRELMTIHACVDYLAGIAAASADVEQIIENDYCAKWINNRDYALDTLYANTVIKGYMDTADKYFYGEWCLMPQVPKMTSNTVPYGTVSASTVYSGSGYEEYRAFDGNSATFYNSAGNTSNQYLGYQFNKVTHINQIKYDNVRDGYQANTNITFKFQVSNDGTNWNDISDVLGGQASNSGKIDVSVDALYVRCLQVSGTYGMAIVELQFYAWQPKGNVPVMTSNNAPYGEASATSQFSADYAAWKAFNGIIQMASTNYWSSANNQVTNQRIVYKFANPICVKRFSICNAGNATRSANHVKLQYSNDGTTWNDADSTIFENPSTALQTTTFTAESTQFALYWGILIVDNHGATNEINVTEVQFYGRELSVSVPAMTSNTAPYGKATANKTIYGSGYAYKAFNNDSTQAGSCTLVYNASMSDGRVNYKFTSAKKILMAVYKTFSTSDNSRVKFARIVYSDDGTTWENASEVITFSASQTVIPINISEPHLYWGIGNIINGGNTGNVFVSELQFYGLDYSEKEFEEGTTKKWLYDHGVELEELTTSGFTDGSYTFTNPVFNEDHIQFDATGSAAEQVAGVNMDLSPYSLVRASRATNDNLMNSGNSTYGNLLVTTGTNLGTTYTATSAIKGPQMTSNSLSLDVSSINQTVWLLIQTWANMRLSINEFWLE